MAMAREKCVVDFECDESNTVRRTQIADGRFEFVCLRHGERWKRQWGCGKDAAKWDAYKASCWAAKQRSDGAEDAQTRVEQIDSEQMVGKQTTAKQTTGHAVVGRRLSVWWPGDKQSYCGTVTEFNAATGRHFVVYEDGEERWHSLHKQRVEWLDNERPAQLPAAQPAQRPAEMRDVNESVAAAHRPQGRGSLASLLDGGESEKNAALDKAHSEV